MTTTATPVMMENSISSKEMETRTNGTKPMEEVQKDEAKVLCRGPRSSLKRKQHQKEPVCGAQGIVHNRNAPQERPINIERFGAGPILKRPLSVPPLFKPPTAKIASALGPGDIDHQLSTGFFTKEREIMAAYQSNVCQLSACSIDVRNRKRLPSTGNGIESMKHNAMGALLGVAMERLQKLT